jgi:hypothetical protein
MILYKEITVNTFCSIQHVAYDDEQMKGETSPPITGSIMHIVQITHKAGNFLVREAECRFDRPCATIHFILIIYIDLYLYN